MGTKFTEGPWQVAGNSNMQVRNNEHSIIADCGNSNVLSYNERKENAKLISTAPDLLTQLIEAKRIIREWHGMGNPDEVQAEEVWNIYDNNSPEMKRINEVIHKATS